MSDETHRLAFSHSWEVERLRRVYDVLHCIVNQAEDEGDRFYFGSTNDPHTMLCQLRVLDNIIAALSTPDTVSKGDRV